MEGIFLKKRKRTHGIERDIEDKWRKKKDKITIRIGKGPKISWEYGISLHINFFSVTE